MKHEKENNAPVFRDETKSLVMGGGGGHFVFFKINERSNGSFFCLFVSKHLHIFRLNIEACPSVVLNSFSNFSLNGRSFVRIE